MTVGCFKFIFVSVSRQSAENLFSQRPSAETPLQLQSANKSSPLNFLVRWPFLISQISAPKPCGGGAASFWKKFGNVFFTQAGFVIFMPGTFNPRIAKHIAMR